MTNDDGRKPEGAPERSPKAGVGAPSGVDGNVPTTALLRVWPVRPSGALRPLRNVCNRSGLSYTIGPAFLAADGRETRHAPASTGRLVDVRPIAKGRRTAAVQ
jgi:hypothetical protein